MLFLLGGLAGFLAARFFKKGSPPTPQMAIEEAQLIKADAHRAAPGDADRRRRSRPAPSKVEAPMSAARTPEEIRRSIEANRAELGGRGREAARRGRQGHRLALASCARTSAR